jgi:hypothetical protein
MVKPSMSAFTVSRQLLKARNALQEDMCRTQDLLRHIQNSFTRHDEIFYLKCLFEYLRVHSTLLFEHVGFRIRIIEKINDAKRTIRDGHYTSNRYLKSMEVAMKDVESLLKQQSVRNAF